MVGKNFSANNVTGKRKKSDFYETPYSLTSQILDTLTETDLGSVVEPAAGNGAIVEVLSLRGIECESYDIETNFLTEERQFDTVITNPPFSLAFEFIQKAKEVARERIILLLPLSYLHGKKRYDHIYQDDDFPLASVNVFTRYPMLGEDLREDGKYKTGMMVYAWYIWERSHEGEPVIRWIDNHEHVLGSRQPK